MKPNTIDNFNDKWTPPECEACGSIYHLAGNPDCEGTPKSGECPPESMDVRLFEILCETAKAHNAAIREANK
jgi:hypothetical protein